MQQLPKRIADLCERLQQLQGSDLGQQGYRDEMLCLLRETPEPLARQQWTPGHITASSFVLSPDDQAILLIWHAKLNRWLQPGGHVEPEDASIDAAARREVAEEVGLTELMPLDDGGLFDLDIHQIPPHKGEPAHLHFDVRMLWRAATWTVQAGSDAQAVRWVPLAEVVNLASDSSVMRAVGRLLQRGRLDSVAHGPRPVP